METMCGAHFEEIHSLHESLKLLREKRGNPEGEGPSKSEDRWLPEDEPEEPENASGVLYLRSGGLNMLTLCPDSMRWLIYLSTAKNMQMKQFRFDTETINDDDPRLPGFQYYDIDFFSRQELSLEPRKTNTRDPTISRMERTILGQIEERKTAMLRHIGNFQTAFVYGLSLLDLPNMQWASRTVTAARDGFHIEGEELQKHLLELTEDACEALSTLLGDKPYFMDDLRDGFADKSCLFGEGKGATSLTLLDVKVAAILILVSKSFQENEIQSHPYISNLKDVVCKHIGLRSLGERVYSLFLKERIPIQKYNERSLNNIGELLSIVKNQNPDGSGGFGQVYKVVLTEGNGWRLPAGEYAFKIQAKGTSHKHFENEFSITALLPYACVTRLVGYGVSPQNEMFLVTKWVSGGDLRSKIGGLSWDQVKKILRMFAYALHTVHKTGNQCIVDLKPENILLDENYCPILCDFGLGVAKGSQATIVPSSYNDYDNDVDFQTDIFAYGVIAIEMVTHEVIEGKHGPEFRTRINKLVEERGIEGLRLRENIGVQQGAANIIRLAIRCLSVDKMARPSTLEICMELEDILV